MSNREEMALRTTLGPLSAPPGLAGSVLRRVRQRNRPALATPPLDVAASTTGVTRVQVGRGQTQAPAAGGIWAEQAREEIGEYLAGDRCYFTVPFDLSLVAPFQRAVLASVQSIPFGEARPYYWVAEQIGRARAARAVGTALRSNPLPLLIPCHRVLRSDGSAGGYALGLTLKHALLQLERETPALVGCATSKILCLRGCNREQRMAEVHRIVFASVKEAIAVGYRPCAICRPRR